MKNLLSNLDKSRKKKFDKNLIQQIFFEDGKFEKNFSSIDVLGQGRFGIVFKGKKMIENKDYAIKVVRIKNNSLQLKDLEKKFIKEVKLLSMFNSKKIT